MWSALCPEREGDASGAARVVGARHGGASGPTTRLDRNLSAALNAMGRMILSHEQDVSELNALTTLVLHVRGNNEKRTLFRMREDPTRRCPCACPDPICAEGKDRSGRADLA